MHRLRENIPQPAEFVSRPTIVDDEPPLQLLSHASSGYATTGSDLPFSTSGSSLDLDRVAHQSHRLRSKDDLPRLRRLLEPRRDVHGIPNRQILALAHQHWAGVNARPEPQGHPDLPGDRRQPLAELGRRPHRPKRIILRTRGIPNTAITASPMNFSTVPP